MESIFENKILSIECMMRYQLMTVEALPFSQNTFGGSAACTVCACGLAYYACNPSNSPIMPISICWKIIKNSCEIWKKPGYNNFLSVEECIKNIKEFKSTDLTIETQLNSLMTNVNINSGTIDKDIINEIQMLPIKDSLEILINKAREKSIPSIIIIIHCGTTIFFTYNEDGTCVIIDTHRRNPIYATKKISSPIYNLENQSHKKCESYDVIYTGCRSVFSSLKFACFFLVELFGKNTLECDISYSNVSHFQSSIYLMKRLKYQNLHLNGDK